MKKYLVIIPVVSLLFTILWGGYSISAAERVYKIGGKGPAGGWIFYDKGNSNGGWRYLEAAPEDQGLYAVWGCPNKSIPTKESVGTGRSNTALVLKWCAGENVAATLCAEYRGGGKSDWYLPSLDELKQMHKKLHKIKAVAFSDSLYWSSTQAGVCCAETMSFGPNSNGMDVGDTKTTGHAVRAIRAFK